MGGIDKSIDNYENVGGGVKNNMNQQLFETINKGKGAELKQLLEGYFSMVNHLGELDYLVDNIDYYDKTLSKLVDFSDTPFMEKTVWRVYDNGQEYCGAYLRNLLTPLKNMIALIRDFSGGKIKEDTFRLFVNKSGLNFEENKKLFLEFCEFLEK